MSNQDKNSKKDTNKKESLLVTKESICATFALFSMLAFLILCTRAFMFGDLGLSVHSFLTGMFGYLAYPVTLGVMYLSIMGLVGKRLVKNRKFAVCFALVLICITLIVHTALTFNWAREDYLEKCFYAGETFPNTTVAGWVGGLVVFGVSAVMSNIGSIVMFALFAAFFVYLCVLTLGNTPKEKAPAVKKSASKKIETQSLAQQNIPEQKTYQPTGKAQVLQRPGVIFEERDVTPSQNIQMRADDSYSPFGKADMVQNTPAKAPKAQNSREILFGGDPTDNFNKNLIFDPKSNANTRPATEPVLPNSYTPSYTDDYANSVNEDEQRPPMTFVSNSGASRGEYERFESYKTEKEEDEPIEPMSYLDTERPVPQAPVEYPIFDEKNFEEDEEQIPEQRNVFGFGDKEEEKPAPTSGEYARHEYMNLFSPENPRLFEEETTRDRNENVFESRRSDFGVREERDFNSYDFEEENRGDTMNIFDEEKDDPYVLRSEDRTETFGRDAFNAREERSDISDRNGFEEPRRERSIGFTDRSMERSVPSEPVRAVEPPKPAEEPKPVPKKPRVIRPYKRVPLDDFDCRDVEPTQNEEEVEQTKQDIIATLEDFKVMGATIASVTFGPTVTRYNVALPRSVSPRKVVALDQSIAISLHSSGVNIYPNYEDGVVSIEVPNKERQFVQLGCMLSGNTFVNAPNGSLMFAMGKNVANAKVYGDISKMIHMLVAGSSGSGKSVFLGALIISMIYKYSPEELRLILIDPKKTEFVLYNNLPHLMINEILTDVNKAVQSLNWAIGEMNRRYTLFEQMSRSGTYVVNLDQYNEKLEKSERLPKIVIIIDELADLMLAAKKDIEDKIQNLTQKARAAGIHLIVATQRPSTDVITGVIKSNLATRIAFGVASEVDSRVILDQSGAQKLLGKGDFLYSMPGINTPVRVQSAFISPDDSQKVVNFIKANNEAYYDEEATAFINNTRSVSDDPASGDKGDTIDPMYIEALRHVILIGSASISMIQRKCSAGYNRAGKIIEWMEDMGYISPFDGAKARKVLITKEDFEAKYGPL